MVKIDKKIKYKLVAIEILGTNKIKPIDIQKILKIKTGDFYTVQEIEIIKKKTEKTLKHRKDILFSSVMMPRYKQQKTTCLTIDFINPKSKIINKIHLIPKKNVKIPKHIASIYKNFNKELIRCFNDPKRSVGIINKDGFAFSEDKIISNYQKKFITIAKNNLELLYKVSREDKSADKRALTTYILGWYPDRQRIINQLQSSFYDPDFEVQNNAALSLIPILNYALETNKFTVPIEPIFDLIQMPSGLSRNKAIALLFQYVQALKHSELIKKRVGKIIKKMAKSKQINHSCYAIPILEALEK